MNIEQLRKYLRVSMITMRRNLYSKKEWASMPREKIKVAHKDKDGITRSRWQYKFDLEKVLNYLKEKFNNDNRI